MVKNKNQLLSYYNCLTDLNLFTEKECMRIVISRTFGYLHFILSFTAKLPQISKIYQTKSVVGISENSVYLDLLDSIFVCLYYFHQSLPVYTYAGNLVNTIQSFIILFFFWYYGNKHVSLREKILRFWFILFLIFYIFVCVSDGKFLYFTIPTFLWIIMVNSKIPLATMSRGSQIIKILKTGQVNAVSETTYFIRILKNFAKIIVIILETKDLILITSNIYSCLLNSSVFILVIFYRRIGQEQIVSEKLSSEKSD